MCFLSLLLQNKPLFTVVNVLAVSTQATKAELKTKEGVLATIERQRAQYEAIGKSRQHVRVCGCV